MGTDRRRSQDAPDLDVGQDLSIGYSRHDTELVTLYLEESFSFRVTEPDAAVVLTDA
ncbi:MAG: encapsulin [Pseudonocardiaceae bacterium]